MTKTLKSSADEGSKNSSLSDNRKEKRSISSQHNYAKDKGRPAIQEATSMKKVSEAGKYSSLLANRSLSVSVCKLVTPPIFAAGALNYARKNSDLLRKHTSSTDVFENSKPHTSSLNGNACRKHEATTGSTVSFLACGSFNPITNSHLRMFEIAKDFFHGTFDDIKVAKGIISPVSDGYGKPGLASAQHRRKMCTLAMENNPWLEVSSWESERHEWTSTLDVLRHTKKEILKGSQSTACSRHKLLLLCGADMFESFNIPGLWLEDDIRTILKEHGVVVVQRPSFDPRKLIYENDILYSLREKIHVITDWINNDTSSTKLRRILRRNESIRYLTPDNVVEYIANNNLYSSAESEHENKNKTLAPYLVNST